MGKPFRGVGAACALALSVLAGIVMPLGDAQIATAQAAVQDQASPEQATQESAAQSAPETEQTAPAAEPEAPASPGTDSSTELTKPSEEPATEPAPEATTEAQPESQATEPATPKKPSKRQLAAPQALAAPSGPTLTWSVLDQNNNLVQGARFRVEGPATSGWVGVQWKDYWQKSFTVSDCVGSCGPESADQDPRPGYFAVDRLIESGSPTWVVSGKRYRITPEVAPSNLVWSSVETREIAQSWRDWTTAANNTWSNNTYQFGTYKAEPPALQCEAGTVYSISTSGQLEKVVVDTTTKIATRTSVGKNAGTSNSDRFNGLGIGAGGEAVFAYERASMPAKVFKFRTSSRDWENTGIEISTENISNLSDLQLIGGAVDPAGTYWVGGFVKQGDSTKGNLQLWALESNGTQMKMRGQLNIRGAEKSYVSNGNGDFAFDNQGNLFVVRGVNNAKDLAVFSAEASALTAASGTNLIETKVSFAQSAVSPFSSVNGIAYDSQGRLFVGGSAGMGYLDLPLSGEDPIGVTLNPAQNWSTTDLASCGFPPTVKLQKSLPNGRVMSSDQFKLELKAKGVSLGTLVTEGTEVNVQPNALGPFPVAVGTEITLTESASGETADLQNYGSKWQCLSGSTEIAAGLGSSGKLTVPALSAGKEILCTITNTVLQVTKTAKLGGQNLPSGTPVDENAVVTYVLTFDNKNGANTANVKYRDYFGDVLDDATFYDAQTGKRATQPTFEAAPNLTTQWNGTSGKQWLDISGTLPAGATRTLEIPVQVLPNPQDAGSRAESTKSQGFFLRNKLARGNEEKPPRKCEPGLCVEHPINAWTVTKDSSPANGARLHKGGNVHYTVAATKLTDTTQLNGLVLTDDLTHVFKTAGWAPGAAVPGGKIGGGVYLLDKDGYSLNAEGAKNSNDKASPKAIRTLDELKPKNVSSDGATPKWLLTTGAPLDVPPNAKKVELRFAVQAAESPAGIPDASQWAGLGNAPSTGWKFVNYATGTAKNSQRQVFAPNACFTGKDVPDTSAAPDAKDQGNPNFPAQCKRTHELSQNYFTIRKDAAGVGVSSMADDSIGNTGKKWDPDPYGLWNMVGHKFQVRDDINGVPSTYPSVKLCRTDYNPANKWDGKWVTPEKAAVEANWDFSSEKSATRAAILDWNNKNPDKKLPECGTLYEITSGNKDKPAGQEGRWRSENLSDGKYWLVETQAPNGQRSEDGQNYRPVAGVQRLAAPIPFTIWPDDESKDGVADHGRGQLDVLNGDNGYVGRCNPGSYGANGQFIPGDQLDKRPTACVNPTGYLMLVRDPAPAPLPLTGGMGPWALWGGGSAALIAAAIGTIWWRSRRADGTRQSGARHAG